MRRIVIAIGSTLTGLVLLFSWPTSLNRAVATAAAEPAGSATTSDTATGSTSEPSADASASADPAPSTEPTTAAPAAAAGTYVGDSVQTRFGPVQVQITVTDGAVTASKAIDYPTSNPKDERINSYAIPVLNSEAVQAQSASIQMVSGATYTSGAYITSLQSALDQAGL